MENENKVKSYEEYLAICKRLHYNHNTKKFDLHKLTEECAKEKRREDKRRK